MDFYVSLFVLLLTKILISVLVRLVTLALVLVIIWVINLHLFAKVMVWVCLLGALALAGLIFGLSCYHYLNLNAEEKSFNQSYASNFTLKSRARNLENETNIENVISFYFKDTLKNEIKSYYRSPTFWLILSILFGVLFLTLSCLICALSGNLQMAVNLIEEASS